MVVFNMDGPEIMEAAPMLINNLLIHIQYMPIKP
jgi:hypothetical protein